MKITYTTTYKKVENIKNIEKLIIQIDLIEYSNLFEGINYKLKIKNNLSTKYRYFKKNKQKAFKIFQDFTNRFNK